MRGIQAGSAYLLVKPNLKGWESAVRRGVVAQSAPAGKVAGSRIGSAMVTAVKGSLATIGATAAVIGGMALKGGLDRLLNIEDAQAKMRALGHTTTEVDAIMESALASVKGTAFGLGEAATTAANALAAGIRPGQELTNYLSMTASAATLAGTSMEEMGSILNKVNTNQVAYTDNLNQLADRGIPIFQWLAKEYGVTQAELSKMVRAGKVDAQTFNKVISENVGDAALIAADTTRGAWANMMAGLSRVGANFLEGIFPMFKRGFQSAITWLEPLEARAKVAGQVLADVLSTTGRWLRDNATWVGRFVAALGGIAAGVAIWETYRRTVQAIRGVKLAYTAATYGAVGATYAQTAAQKLAYAAGRTQIVVTKGLTIAQKALNLALSNNPIGWVIRIVTALVAVLYLAYRESEEFRAVVDNLWRAIKVGAKAAFGWLLDVGIPLMLQGFSWLGDKAAWLWSTAVGPAFRAIGDTAAWLYHQAIGPAFKLIGDILAATFGWVKDTGWPWMRVVFTAIGTVVSWLWTTIYRPILGALWSLTRTVFGWVKDTGWPWLRVVFTAIGNAVSWLWTTFYKPTFERILSLSRTVFGWVKNTGWPWIRDALTAVGSKATWLWKNGISPAFNGIKSVISTAWDGIKVIFDKLKAGLNSVRDRFRSIRDGIGNIWGSVTALVAKPVNSVISFFNRFLSGLESAINKIPGVSITLPRLRQIAVPSTSARASSRAGALRALAGGGPVPGPFLGPTADNVLGIGPGGVPVARINPREWIQPVAAVNYYGPGFMKAIQHRLIPRGLLGLAGGGQVGTEKGTDDISVGSILWDFIKNPAKAVSGLFSRLLSGIGDSWPAQVVVGAVKSTASALVKWVKEKIFGSEAGDGQGRFSGTGLGHKMMAAIIQAAVPGARISSGYRPGAITASGFPSYHGRGRAIDIVGPMAQIFSYLRANWASSAKELYWSPAGWLQLRNGRPHYPTGVTRANHFDHVHWAMGAGGQVPAGPYLYDNGGPLPPGDTWVRNATGRTEWVVPGGSEMRISSGWLEISGDGLARIVDGRIEAASQYRQFAGRRP